MINGDSIHNGNFIVLILPIIYNLFACSFIFQLIADFVDGIVIVTEKLKIS